MSRSLSILALAMIALAVNGQSLPPVAPAPAPTPAVTPAQPAAPAKPTVPAFETLKTLAGEWVRTKANAQGVLVEETVSIYKVTGGGSVVHETIFPGLPYEMITVYHLDGTDVLATHYCSAGNQPRYKLAPESQPNKLIFNFNGGTNMNPAKDMHMHEGTLTIVDADHIEGVWQGFENGVADPKHKAVLKLARKKPPVIYSNPPMAPIYR